MGQKVHPKGFRLGIFENWDAKWFAKKSLYGKNVIEDLQVRRFIKDRLGRTDVAKIEIERSGEEIRLVLHTAKAGIVIGKKGQGIEQLRAAILAKFGRNASISVNEIKNPDLEAAVVAASIAEQIENRANYKRAMKKAGFAAQKVGAVGVKICCSGRLGGAEIARDEWFRVGSVPLHTLRSHVDYASIQAKTIYGVIGVKVWICRGTY